MAPRSFSASFGSLAASSWRACWTTRLASRMAAISQSMLFRAALVLVVVWSCRVATRWTEDPSSAVQLATTCVRTSLSFLFDFAAASRVASTICGQTPVLVCLLNCQGMLEAGENTTDPCRPSHNLAVKLVLIEDL